MSRIQNVLEKAERDGVVHRLSVASDLDGGRPMIAMTPLPTPAPVATVEPLPAEARYREVPDAFVSPRLITSALADSVAAEQYRSLRTRIMHADTGAAVNLLLVTSPGDADGKSLTAANLALIMAQEYQRRVCLIDVNLRTPNVHRLFGIPEVPGLMDVILGHATVDDAIVRVPEHRLHLMPAGSAAAHPAELLGTTTMRRTLDTLRTRFDCVIADAPAAGPLADVRILAPLVDSVLLVVRAGVTSKPAVHEALAALDPAKLVGIVLNDAAA